MTILAPSRAARRAIARPMPRLAPEMKRVLPARLAMAGSGLAEFRRAPADERGDALGEVGRRGTAREGFELGLELRFERRRAGRIEQALALGVGELRAAGETRRHRIAAHRHALSRRCTVNEAEAQP